MFEFSTCIPPKKFKKIQNMLFELFIKYSPADYLLSTHLIGLKFEQTDSIDYQKELDSLFLNLYCHKKK